MAKQSGLHQIKGKVGEFSYYKQTGVDGGLVRQINQGMSARVKNDEGYANTRLNNVEFGGACNVAAKLGQMVLPKFRPMILPFSQSKMAKAVLELAKSAGGNWGERCVPADSHLQLAEILGSMSKRDSSEFATITQTFNTTSKEMTSTVAISDEQATLMANLGISKLAVKLQVFHLETGKYNSAENRIRSAVSESRLTATENFEIVAGHGDSTNIVDEQVVTPGYSPIPPTGYNAQYIAVYVFMPIRTINDVDHVLQEYCSFKAIGFAYTA